jgi:hypothetical protein
MGEPERAALMLARGVVEGDIFLVSFCLRALHLPACTRTLQRRSSSLHASAPTNSCLKGEKNAQYGGHTHYSSMRPHIQYI